MFSEPSKLPLFSLFTYFKMAATVEYDRDGKLSHHLPLS